ncbi:MAG: putative DNA-binding domain-containing protein [Rhodospirillales bacterium]|nr:putative DNA-binding domain-containing protein [Rhodospirillales bacterium]
MLLEFQRDFAAFLLRAAAPPPAIGRAPGEAVRFDVYRHNFTGNIVGALSGAYPGLHRALGDAPFGALAAAFAAASPPAEADLHRYGEDFARHVAQAMPEPVWLADLARLDWAFSCALHAPDAPALSLEALAEALRTRDDTQDLVLRAHPSLRLLTLAHPVRALREALLAEDDAAALDAIRDVAATGERLAVLRGTAGMTALTLAPAALRLATELAGGVALDAALAEEADGEALRLFLDHGMFSEAEVT